MLNSFNADVRIVQVSHEEGKSAAEEEEDGLAGALARALQQREKAIHGRMWFEKLRNL